jgi:hypothetical protein
MAAGSLIAYWSQSAVPDAMPAGHVNGSWQALHEGG